MKPMAKNHQDAHSFSNDTGRKKQSKTPKKSGDRIGNKTAFRQKNTRDLIREVNQITK